jgi:hypothetical protein
MRPHWLFVSGLGCALVVWLAKDARTVPSPPRVVTTEKTIVVHRPSDEFTAPRHDLDTRLVTEHAARDPESARDAPPTVEQDTAAQEATVIVDDAIAAGHWTSADNDRIAPILHRMHPEARDEVILAWASAVNAQRIALDAPPAF